MVVKKEQGELAEEVISDRGKERSKKAPWRKLTFKAKLGGSVSICQANGNGRLVQAEGRAGVDWPDAGTAGLLLGLTGGTGAR